MYICTASYQPNENWWRKRLFMKLKNRCQLSQDKHNSNWKNTWSTFDHACIQWMLMTEIWDLYNSSQINQKSTPDPSASVRLTDNCHYSCHSVSLSLQLSDDTVGDRQLAAQALTYSMITLYQHGERKTSLWQSIIFSHC